MPRHRRASPPSDEVVGGLWSKFELIRTTSGPSPRRVGERARGRRDGVEATPHHRDAVAGAVRESMSSTRRRDAFAAAVSVVHSRTYGVAGEQNQGYFRALLPLADLLNHAGDEYDPEASFFERGADDAETVSKKQMWPPARDADNVAWSALDGSGTIAFAATKALAPGDEATAPRGLHRWFERARRAAETAAAPPGLRSRWLFSPWCDEPRCRSRRWEASGMAEPDDFAFSAKITLRYSRKGQLHS